MKHTILSRGGAIGTVLAYQLLKYGEDVKIVSRNNYQVPGVQTMSADLYSYYETLKCIKNSDIVFLCFGLPYENKPEAEFWPTMMQNVIDACKSENAKLIFFDNTYMYGRVKGKMTETTPYNPHSKTGELRAKISMMLEKEISINNINAIIARSADLYGPHLSENSLLHKLAIGKMIAGKRAQWLIDAYNLHSFTYSIDAAKGLALLSLENECYNQIWHLPTRAALDGETIIHILANHLGISPDYVVLNKSIVQLTGLFNRSVFELFEMIDQFEFNYYFDSSKFNQFFNYEPKSYFEGIRDTIELLRNRSIENNNSAYLPLYTEKAIANLC